MSRLQDLRDLLGIGQPIKRGQQWTFDGEHVEYRGIGKRRDTEWIEGIMIEHRGVEIHVLAHKTYLLDRPFFIKPDELVVEVWPRDYEMMPLHFDWRIERQANWYQQTIAEIKAMIDRQIDKGLWVKPKPRPKLPIVERQSQNAHCYRGGCR